VPILIHYKRKVNYTALSTRGKLFFFIFSKSWSSGIF